MTLICEMTFNYFIEWILNMICFEFKIAEANWLTLLLLIRGESARNFNVIVLQDVNSNYGLKTVTRISPYHCAVLIFYQNAVTSYFCLLTVLDAEYRR